MTDIRKKPYKSKEEKAGKRFVSEKMKKEIDRIDRRWIEDELVEWDDEGEKGR